MGFRIVALDHVQLAMPPDAEAVADAFYCGVLGFEVLPKPEPLASRGGRWFVCDHVQVHLGVEPHFAPARKAHPALVVDDFDELVAGLDAAAAESGARTTTCPECEGATSTTLSGTGSN